MSLLRTQPEFEVIGEISVGYELMKLPDDILPDIVIMDSNLPTIKNIDPVSLIHQWNAAIRILILSDALSPNPAIKAFQNGALGYVVRFDDFEHLAQAIHSVYHSRRYLSQAIEDQILDSLVSGKGAAPNNDDRISSREREILKLIAEGKTNAEIGKLLVISTRTVETHRTNLMHKLGLSSQIDIIRYALKEGILSTSDLINEKE